jgi:hypothetical protein
MRCAVSTYRVERWCAGSVYWAGAAPSAAGVEAPLRRCLRDLYRDMGQGLERSQASAVIRGVSGLFGGNREQRAQVARSQPPEVQIDNAVAVDLNGSFYFFPGGFVWTDIQQDAAGVA